MAISLAMLLAFSLFTWFQPNKTYDSHALESPSRHYNVLSKPTVDAEFINRVLDHYQSPASGKGQSLYDYGIKYGIDPAFALAFFLHESTCGTQGVATTTHSLGNIRATAGHPEYHGFRAYSSWEEGFEDWYRLIAEKYVAKWGLTTIDQIIPVYAPNADHNNEAGYIRAIKLAVDHWREGRVAV